MTNNHSSICSLRAARVCALAACSCASPAAPPVAAPPAAPVAASARPPAAHRFDQATSASLEHYVVDAMQRFAVPGASVAVVQGGRVVYERGFGVRELGGGEPVSPATLMMIGSTNKSMTTMMMATLVDDGRLRWETPAASVLPWFALRDPQLTHAMTMRYLVCNCTGLPRSDLELMSDARPRTATDVIRSLRGRSFTGRFGSTFQYSNQLVAAGGYIAAHAGPGATGDLFDDYVSAMQKRVFDPIGMTSTTFSFDRVQANPDHAVPHGWSADETLTPIAMELEQLVTPLVPAGGAWSNATDLARYLLTQLGRGVAPDGARVVSSENLEVTWQPHVRVSADTSYALGWGVASYRGLRILTHNGGTYGFSSNLTLVPDAGLGVVVLANANSELFVSAIWQRVLELVYRLPMEADARLARRAEQAHREMRDRLARLAPLDRSVVEPMLGGYHNPVLGRVTLALRDGRLVLEIGRLATELRSMDDATYLVWDPPLGGALRVALHRDGPGRSLVLTSTAVDEPATYLFTALR